MRCLPSCASLQIIDVAGAACLAGADAMDRGDIVVIELNPFLPSTGPCLYSWTIDADVLAHGPFSYRVAERPSTWSCVVVWLHGCAVA